jgi:hypothetical protein
MGLTALVVHCARWEKEPADKSRAEGLLFMTLLTRQAFVCRSQLQLSAHPAAHLFHNLSRLARPLLHNLHDMQSDSSTGGARQVSLLPERSH